MNHNHNQRGEDHTCWPCPDRNDASSNRQFVRELVAKRGGTQQIEWAARIIVREVYGK
jgi:hypothetical protein